MTYKVSSGTLGLYALTHISPSFGARISDEMGADFRGVECPRVADAGLQLQQASSAGRSEAGLYSLI